MMFVRPPHTHTPSQGAFLLTLQAGEYTGAATIFGMRGHAQVICILDVDFRKVLLDLRIVRTGQKSLGGKENSC